MSFCKCQKEKLSPVLSCPKAGYCYYDAYPITGCQEHPLRFLEIAVRVTQAFSQFLAIQIPQG